MPPRPTKNSKGKQSAESSHDPAIDEVPREEEVLTEGGGPLGAGRGRQMDSGRSGQDPLPVDGGLDELDAQVIRKPVPTPPTCQQKTASSWSSRRRA